MRSIEETLTLMNDFADGIVQLERMSDSDLSNIITVLEKEMPKKPELSRVNEDTIYCKCPSCVITTVLYDGCQMKYCKNCGQKLDWVGGE